MHHRTKNALASVVAVIPFIVLTVVGYAALYLLDMMRGLGNDTLQMVFRELFVPGMAGYLALMWPLDWFEGASARNVFYWFSGMIFVLVGLNLGIVLPTAEKAGITVWEIMLGLGNFGSALVGAYIAVRNDL